MVALLLITSCKEDKKPEPSTKANVNFKVNVNAGGEAFVNNKTYSTADGLQYSFELVKFYLSDIKLVKDDGSKVDLKELVFVDMDDPIGEPYDRNSIGTNFTFETQAGNYNALELGVGVPKRINQVSNDYPNEHPLSVYRGTDWSWAGYRLLMLEGLANKTGTSEKTTFDYHIAADTFYQYIKLDKAINISAGSTQEIVLNVDLEKVFQPASTSSQIDPVKEFNTHSEGSEEKINLAWKVIRNFSKAISL